MACGHFAVLLVQVRTPSGLYTPALFLLSRHPRMAWHAVKAGMGSSAQNKENAAIIFVGKEGVTGGMAGSMAKRRAWQRKSDLAWRRNIMAPPPASEQ